MNTQTSLVNVSEISERAGAVGGYIKDAGETLRNAGDYRVEVVGGYHTGAVLNEKPGEILVGSGNENNLILFADDVANSHVQISLPSKLIGKIRVTPIEQSIALEDGSVVEVGQYAEINDGEVITIGSAAVEIKRVGSPKQFAKPLLRVVSVICLIAMIPLLYNVFSGMVTGAVGAGSQAFTQIQKQISAATNGYVHASYGQGKPANDAYLWAVRTKLEELGLNFRIRVSNSGQNSLRVSGAIMNEEAPSWNAFLQWYDSKKGFPSLIRDVQRSDVDADLPKIKSVWLDDKPTVFFHDGTTANIGSRINKGWTVTAINQSGVTIERDGASVALTY